MPRTYREVMIAWVPWRVRPCGAAWPGASDAEQNKVPMAEQEARKDI